jgi:hypothetical protein
MYFKRLGRGPYKSAFTQYFSHKKHAQRNFVQLAVITAPNTRAGRGIVYVFELRLIYVKSPSLSHSRGYILPIPAAGRSKA